MAKIFIDLEPGLKEIVTSPDFTFKEALEEAGYLFPNNCGGKGVCLSCRIEFQTEPPAITDLERQILGEDSLTRMACRHRVIDGSRIILPANQIWDKSKQLWDYRIPGGGEGYGVAIDLGTTLVAVYLVDLETGQILSQHSFLNPQIPFGGDVMARLQSAKDTANLNEMTDLIQNRVSRVINRALIINSLQESDITAVSIVGNSVMTHLWLGENGEGLDRAPFRSSLEGKPEIRFNPKKIGLDDNCRCFICPIISGFIGGDAMAAILATELDSINYSHTPYKARLLIDIGTNGEIILAADEHLYATSTAAGPAFEGVGMLCGMPALPGAAEDFDGQGRPIIIGRGKPLGICGSGYISLIAWLLDHNKLSDRGLLEKDGNGERQWFINPDRRLPPKLVQDDVRKFQLAKGAIATGIETLCEEAGITEKEIDDVILTGSFGNRIKIEAAIRVGLLPSIEQNKVRYIDNAAGRGATLMLADSELTNRIEKLQKRIQVINLGDSPCFQDRFAENMLFPGR